jgi:hypothetical protein
VRFPETFLNDLRTTNPPNFTKSECPFFKRVNRGRFWRNIFPVLLDENGVCRVAQRGGTRKALKTKKILRAKMNFATLTERKLS